MLARLVYLVISLLLLVLALALPFWYCHWSNQKHLYEFCAYGNLTDYYNSRKRPQGNINGRNNNFDWMDGTENPLRESLIYRLVFGFLTASLILATISLLQDFFAYFVDFRKADHMCLIARNFFIIAAATCGIVGVMIYVAHTKIWSIFLAILGVAMILGEGLRIMTSTRFKCEP